MINCKMFCKSGPRILISTSIRSRLSIPSHHHGRHHLYPADVIGRSRQSQFRVIATGRNSQLPSWLPTQLAGKVLRSIVSVRPFSFYLLNQLTLDLDFCICVGHDHSSPGIESQGHRSRSKISAKMFVLHEYLLRRPMSID